LVADARSAGWHDPSRRRISASPDPRSLSATIQRARAAIERLVDLVVGPGLRLRRSRTALRWESRSEGHCASSRRTILKSEWRLFADDPRRLCDAQRAFQ